MYLSVLAALKDKPRLKEIVLVDPLAKNAVISPIAELIALYRINDWLFLCILLH